MRGVVEKDVAKSFILKGERTKARRGEGMGSEEEFRKREEVDEAMLKRMCVSIRGGEQSVQKGEIHWKTSGPLALTLVISENPKRGEGSGTLWEKTEIRRESGNGVWI